jgi:hypothetical protein
MIDSRESLKDYCFARLGAPYSEINVEETQLDYIIDDCVQRYQDFAENGTERTYFRHLLATADITNKFISLPSNITGIIRVLSYTANGSVGGASPFNATYELQMDIAFNSANSGLLYFTQMQQYLSLIDQTLNGQPLFRFNRVMDKLFLDTDWSRRLRAGMWIVAECYAAIDPDTYTKMWNEPWFKSYTTAKIKQQWGTNLKKFSGIAMIGGTTLNGQLMYDEATEEILMLEKELRDVWEAPPSFFTG